VTLGTALGPLGLSDWCHFWGPVDLRFGAPQIETANIHSLDFLLNLHWMGSGELCPHSKQV